MLTNVEKNIYSTTYMYVGIYIYIVNTTHFLGLWAGLMCFIDSIHPVVYLFLRRHDKKSLNLKNHGELDLGTDSCMILVTGKKSYFCQGSLC